MTDNHTIAADFDRLASFSGDGANNNSTYHPWLLSRLPAHCGCILDAGCGAGQLSQALAERADRVVSIDLSRAMLARGLARGVPANALARADFTRPPFAQGSFDAIVSVAALHHVPLDAALPPLATLLRPGGILLVIDLLRPSLSRHIATYALGGTVMRAAALWRRPATAAERAAWRAHDVHDRYPSLEEVRLAAGRHLPGAVVQLRLLWRYTLEWRAPA